MNSFRFRLRIEHLWGFAALVGIFAFISTHPIRPQDFWWHITIGREIATTGKIPTVDIYSYTAGGQEYPSYQMFWLMETVLYELYHVGGAALVVFVHAIWITLAYVILFWLCKTASQSWRIAAFCVLLAAALGLNDWNVRPQGITFLLGGLFLLAIYNYRHTAHWRWLALLPIGMLVWVNSHGTFLIGLVLIGLWWGQVLWEALLMRQTADRVNQMRAIILPGAMLLLTTLVCLLNPRGIGILAYLKTLTSNPVIQNLVVEWAAPTLHTYLGIIFYVCLLLFILLLVFSPKRPSFYQVATLLVFGVLAARTSRGIVWFGFIMAPVIAEHLAAWVTSFQKNPQKTVSSAGSPVLNLSFGLIILCMGVISLPWLKSYLPLPTAKAGLISSETPIKATEVLLEKNPPGRLFNSMSFGSYLIWAAFPQYQDFVDTRIELFPEKVWLDYINISNAQGSWEERLSAYGVNTLFLSPTEQYPLVVAVSSSPGWKLLYQDDSGILFVRQ